MTIVSKVTQVTEKGDLLISAIESYHSRRGEYPDSLNALVPEYISAITHTGMCIVPDFKYEKPKHPVVRQKHGEYEIKVSVIAGFYYSGKLVYWPTGEYPKNSRDLGVRRFGKWALISE